MRSFALTLALTLAACHKSGEDCSEGFGLAADGNCYPLATDAQTIGDADADADSDSDADADADADADTGDTGSLYFPPGVIFSGGQTVHVDQGWYMDLDFGGYVLEDIARTSSDFRWMGTNGGWESVNAAEFAYYGPPTGDWGEMYIECLTIEATGGFSPLLISYENIAVGDFICGRTEEGRITTIWVRDISLAYNLYIEVQAYTWDAYQ